jgi:hypothetical protein
MHRHRLGDGIAARPVGIHRGILCRRRTGERRCQTPIIALLSFSSLHVMRMRALLPDVSVVARVLFRSFRWIGSGAGEAGEAAHALVALSQFANRRFATDMIKRQPPHCCRPDTNFVRVVGVDLLATSNSGWSKKPLSLARRGLRFSCKPCSFAAGARVRELDYRSIDERRVPVLEVAVAVQNRVATGTF